MLINLKFALFIIIVSTYLSVNPQVNSQTSTNKEIEPNLNQEGALKQNEQTPIKHNNTNSENFYIKISKNTIELYFNHSFSTKLILIYLGVIIGGILLLAAIYSFCKVPLKKGYSCRCCMRTKWFIKAVIFIIVCPCVVTYYIMNALFGCMDGLYPDTKIEDCKLDEPPEEEKKSAKNKFVALEEEDPERKNEEN